LNTLIRL